ncbi:unnamed protein product [Protopolystoma xenopodis]|uniref:Amidase domain-containing protein n=1 Tax=Protopolystoma xenopodis TaxID=117903 RepID=A0A448X9S9_9PLAT|nr:unnamed protein product [Protopolystoma xenopodis]
MLCACLDTNQPVCDSTLLNLDTNDLTLFRNELKNISCSKLPKPLKLGVPVEYHAPGLSNEILDVWERVCCWCADRLSLEIRKVSIPHMRFACATYAVLCSTEVASNMSRYDGLEFGYRARPQIMDEQANSEFGSTEELFAASRSASLGEVVRSRILAGNYFMLTKNQMNYLDAARKMWRLICSEFNDVLSDQVDFLLAPVHLTTASTILDFSLLDNRTRSSRDDVLTSPVNLAGLPAVTIPVATSKETGLPIGLQLIGPALSEPKLLSLALCIERMARFKHLVDLSEILNAD